MAQIIKGAEFSKDKAHRLSLWRIWDISKPKIMFIGLNPSTANQDDDDPTIRRVINFSKQWGFGGVYMMNLFTQVTPYPKDLVLNNERELIKNRELIINALEVCKTAVFAWGNFKEAEGEAKFYTEVINGFCLGKNKNNSPKHPLYIKQDTVLIRYKTIDA